jgi:hypothetical protein
LGPSRDDWLRLIASCSLASSAVGWLALYTRIRLISAVDGNDVAHVPEGHRGTTSERCTKTVEDGSSYGVTIPSWEAGLPHGVDRS